MKRITLLTACTLLSLASVACDGDKKTNNKSEAAKKSVDKKSNEKVAAGDPKAAIDAAWKTCVPCHGESGTGDGVAGVALNPKPRDFTDATWQAKVDDAHLKKVIVEGGTGVGLSPLMTPNPQLKGNDAVLDGLVAKIRGLKK